jgi:RNA polymerase sigma-70 factor, ECF subfamily
VRGTSPLLSEVPELYQRSRNLNRESLAIVGPSVAWDWAGLRARCLREAVRVLPRADAEEAVQEALARAWVRRDACHSPDAPLPWLLEITRNEARRQLGRKARLASLELFESTASERERADEVAIRVTVQQALGKLAEGDRRLLRLRYAEDLTQGEVARRLGMAEGTVKVRLHRARRRLRKLIEG